MPTEVSEDGLALGGAGNEVDVGYGLFHSPHRTAQAGADDTGSTLDPLQQGLGLGEDFAQASPPAGSSLSTQHRNPGEEFLFGLGAEALEGLQLVELTGALQVVQGADLQLLEQHLRLLGAEVGHIEQFEEVRREFCFERIEGREMAGGDQFGDLRSDALADAGQRRQLRLCDEGVEIFSEARDAVCGYFVGPRLEGILALDLEIGAHLAQRLHHSRCVDGIHGLRDSWFAGRDVKRQVYENMGRRLSTSEDHRQEFTRAKAAQLKPLLDAFVEHRPWPERIRFDPVEFPHRFTDRSDVEVVGLLSACLAYGRAHVFKPKVAMLVERLGAHPAHTVAALTPRAAAALTHGFIYRFNVAADVAVLLLGMGRVLARFGSLEAVFLRAVRESLSWEAAVAAFSAQLLTTACESELESVIGPTRGLAHLLPQVAGGPFKRLNLFLRWMVRGPDAIDFGVWRQVSAAQLIIPLDTHVARISRWLGLTRRRDVSWRTAEDVTASLRRLDASDPTRYDFALCHYGMSGACPPSPVAENCRHCSLKGQCLGRSEE